MQIFLNLKRKRKIKSNHKSKSLKRKLSQNNNRIGKRSNHLNFNSQIFLMMKFRYKHNKINNQYKNRNRIIFLKTKNSNKNL